jgi:hypothetical protein
MTLDPRRLGTFEKVGAWLRIWTPHRGVEVPPPPWRKIALAAFVVLAVVGGIVALAGPAIDRGKEKRAREEQRRTAALEAAKRDRLAKEMRPQHGRGERPTGKLSPTAERRARRELVADLERAITRDARARARAGTLDGPVLETECTIPPSLRRVERDLRARGSDYDCLAITRRGPRGQFVIGDSFDAVVDYRRFRFTWHRGCRVPGEGAARITC